MMAVGAKWVKPWEFWKLHPQEFWWLYEAHVGFEESNKWETLYSMLE